MSTTQPKPIVWTEDEEKVFSELHIAPADIHQRELVRGIRRAIGRLVAANIEIVKALKAPGTGDLAMAERLLQEVAGSEPPRCELQPKGSGTG